MNKPFSRANLKCDIVLHFVWFGFSVVRSLHWIGKCVSVLFVCMCVFLRAQIVWSAASWLFAFEWSRRLYAQTMRHKKRSNRLYLQSLQPHVAFAWLCNWFIWMKRWKKDDDSGRTRHDYDDCTCNGTKHFPFISVQWLFFAKCSFVLN